jgi:RNase P subunit RPR2
MKACDNQSGESKENGFPKWEAVLKLAEAIVRFLAALIELLRRFRRNSLVRLRPKLSRTICREGFSLLLVREEPRARYTTPASCFLRRLRHCSRLFLQGENNFSALLKDLTPRTLSDTVAVTFAFEAFLSNVIQITRFFDDTYQDVY